MKGMDWLCSSPASTAIISSMDQRLVVRPSSRSYRHDGRKIQPRVPCSSHFPINPKPYRNRNKQNDDVRRKSCVEVSELINTRTSCSSKRYLLSDAPFVDWVSRYKDDLAPAHPSKYQVVVLRVSLHCKGCEGKVRKHISKMEGVTWFSIELETKKVTIVGDVTPLDVLASVSKVKRAQLWPSSSFSSSSTPF